MGYFTVTKTVEGVAVKVMPVMSVSSMQLHGQFIGAWLQARYVHIGHHAGSAQAVHDELRPPEHDAERLEAEADRNIAGRAA